MFKDNRHHQNKEVNAYTAHDRYWFRNTGRTTPCTLWLFMLRLTRHEPDLVERVAWFMGYYLGDALLDWLIWVPKLEQAIQRLPPDWSKLTPKQFAERKLIPHETMKVLFRIVYPRCNLGLRAEVLVVTDREPDNWLLRKRGHWCPEWVPRLPPEKGTRYIGIRKRDDGAWHPLRLLPVLEQRIYRSGPRRAPPRPGALRKNPQARGKSIDGGWVLRRLFHKTGASFFGPCGRVFWDTEGCYAHYNDISHIQRTRAEKCKTKDIKQGSSWTDRGEPVDTGSFHYDRWCIDPQRPYLVSHKYETAPLWRGQMLFIPECWDTLVHVSFADPVDYGGIDRVYRLPN